jgi:hypothetical protein
LLFQDGNEGALPGDDLSKIQSATGEISVSSIDSDNWLSRNRISGKMAGLEDRALTIGRARMPLELNETEAQRRRRVSSRIRNELIPHIADALVEAARQRKIPNDWLTADFYNDLLEDLGCWDSHPDPMAAFLSPEGRAQVVEKALDQLTVSHADLWACAGDKYKPAGRDWNDYAAKKASLIRQQFPLAERTAYHVGADGASVLFAHDDFVNDPRAIKEVALLRQHLADKNIPELGFGLSEDGKTWVMIVYSDDAQSLERALFKAWETACCSVAEETPAQEIQFDEIHFDDIHTDELRLDGELPLDGELSLNDELRLDEAPVEEIPFGETSAEEIRFEQA